MCYEVSCHRFLYDYFQKNRKNSRVSIRQINNIIGTIEKTLSSQIRIDVTQDSLSSVINSSAGNVELELDNRHIVFKDSFLNETSDSFYEEELPTDLQEKYAELLEQA